MNREEHRTKLIFLIFLIFFLAFGLKPDSAAAVDQKPAAEKNVSDDLPPLPKDLDLESLPSLPKNNEQLDLPPLPPDTDLAPLPTGAEGAGEQLARTLREVKIAIVRDGPSVYFDEHIASTKKELDVLAEGDFKPVFLEGDEYNAGWSSRQASTVLARALKDEEVEIVLTLGPLTNKAALKMKKLNKPVVTGFVMDAQFIGFEVDEQGFSKKENLSGVIIPNRIPFDLKAMKRMFKFETLYILVDEPLLTSWPDMARILAPMLQEAGITKIQIKPMAATAEETLARLDPVTELVYLTPPWRMSEEERQALFDGFNQRKILTYSMLGGMDLDEGILAGSMQDISERLARRVALNLQQIALGASPNEVPTDLEVQERMTVNAATAKIVDYWPDFDLAIELRFVNVDVEDKGCPISLGYSVCLAAKQNIDLKIKEAETEAALWSKSKVGSNFWPQMSHSTQYVQIDHDRSEASRGSVPWQELKTGFKVSQILFSDEIISNFRAAGKLYDGAFFEQEAVRLDLMAEGATRFLDFLSARSLFKIEAQNLSLVEKNLELARARVRVGISGREEVIRLESEEAQRKGALFEAEARLQAARVALNQALGMAQDNRWKPRDVSADDPDQVYLNVQLRKYIHNMLGVQVLTDFLVSQARQISPTLHALDLAVEAQDILVGQLKRSYVVPNLNAQAEWSHLIDEHPGADVPMSSTPPSTTTPGTKADRQDWSLALVLSLPIFEGGGRHFDIQKAKANRRSLANQRERARQLIEQRLRTALYSMNHSGPNIQLTRIAADKAVANLDIVRDKYARGTAGLLDLIDAQNQVLNQEQAASVANYSYLKDYVEAQRAACWFEFDRAKEEIDLWLEYFHEYIQLKTPEIQRGLLQ